MNQFCLIRKRRTTWFRLTAVGASVLFVLSCATISTLAQQRVLGIDVSTYQGNLSTTTWATFKRPTDQQVSGVFGDGRDFVLIRSSRGGTTGEDHRQGGYPAGNNTLYSLSERYDDPYFVQNITRATTAGMFAGPYHFARPDVIASTPNTGGIANNGTDEADHFIQMAGAWMRPKYLLPVFDLEAGNNRTAAELATFCIEFSDRINQVMGIRPMMYINGSYSTLLQSSGSAAALVTAFPKLWDARYTSNDDPSSTAYLTGNPKDSFAGFYGPWDDAPNPTHPWSFWQYGSQGGLNGYGGNLDKNVANGGTEFLKDHLVPALWMNDADGPWTTLLNWNSGQTPAAPATGAGQLSPIGTQTLPTASLPDVNDTVILDRPNTNITITLSSGTQNIRKLYVRETLNITGGSLNLNYVPSADSTTNAAQFSGPVTLGGSGSLSLNTLQVDSTQTFTLAGGTLTFNTVNLMPHASTPAKILMSGNVIFNSLSNATAAVIAPGVGAGSPGLIDLGGATRTFNVGNGPADVDLSVEVAISNGGFSKTGLGAVSLNKANTYGSGTTISAGRLLVNNTTGSGTGSGAVMVNGGFLGGTGSISGIVTVNTAGTIAPGTASALGKLTFNNVPTFDGTNFMRVNRNGGSSLADKLVLTSGTLNYGGTLVVSNAGATLTGGEVFTNFAASSYSGAFANTILPSLTAGLNWYTDNLTTDGTIKVNRAPVANPNTFTNEAPLVLQIPIASLLGNDSDPDGDVLTLTGVSLTTTNGIALVTNSTFITYSNFVSVADQFSYDISDGHGGSATGVVTIAASPTGRFAGAPSGNANSMTLQFVGSPGWTYYLERSTNLPDWLTIWTNVAPPDGVFGYTDDFVDLGGPPATAFYRLRWTP